MVSFAELYEQAWRKQPQQRERLAASVLYELARDLSEQAGLSAELLETSRLARLAGLVDAPLAAQLLRWALPEEPRDLLTLAHRLGQSLDALLALEAAFERGQLHSTRKKSGSFFTPAEVARTLIDQSVPLLACRTPTVCDPAVGGGAFLLEAARALVEREQARGSSLIEARNRVWWSLFGMDRMPLAVAVAEVALWLYLNPGGVEVLPNPRLRVGDSLAATTGQDAPPGGFDWIVGNPPWVSFQGRAARPLPPEERAYFRTRFRSFRGYPTLHGMFVERSAELAPSGTISLLLPSSLSDLDGYRAARTRLTETHRPREPLQEYGQDAFADVVQPCFGLVAEPRELPGPGQPSSWLLNERARQRSAAALVPTPEVLTKVARLPALPPEIFRELGFQTNRQVSAELLRRAPTPEPPFELGLLEGKRVREFVCLPPALFLHVDRALLAQTKCLLRPRDTYRNVSFLVRQTAAFPIAAAHNGHVFRNSLLAGFATPDLDSDLLLGLLNSALYRALHVAGQRDARQAAFPQVKVSHLRKLPCPPSDEGGREAVRELSRRASSMGSLGMELRRALDQAVFELFQLEESERRQVLGYLSSRAASAVTSMRPREGARSGA